MTFNKKLLALAIAHFAFAQFVFASDDEMEVQKVSKTAVAAAKYVESGLVSLNSYVNIDKAVFKGSGWSFKRIWKRWETSTKNLRTGCINN